MNMRSVFNNPRAFMQVQHPITVHKDTAAWKAQAWISFGIAATIAASASRTCRAPISIAPSW